MAETLTVAELVKRNKQVAGTHLPIPTFAELGSLGLEPPHIAILTCLDPRCRPELFLDLKPTDGAFVMRNIAGHVGPALNDIVALDAFLGVTDIMIVHHTDCGSTHFKDAGIRETLKARLPDNKDIDGMSFGAIDDLKQSIRDDLAILKYSPIIRPELAERSIGFLFDIKTGLLEPVEG